MDGLHRAAARRALIERRLEQLARLQILLRHRPPATDVDVYRARHALVLARRRAEAAAASASAVKLAAARRAARAPIAGVPTLRVVR